MIHAGFQLPHNMTRQPHEPVPLHTRELPRSLINDAERPDPMPIRGGERSPSVETNVRLPRD